MFDAVTGEHIYVSTACLHDRHELCRLACKHCGTPCWCDHHYIHLEGLPVTTPENLDNPAAPDTDVDNPSQRPTIGEPVVEPTDDGPSIPDPDHGIPGDPEPLPEGDADTDTEPDDEDDDLADDDPEEVDESEDDEVIEGDPVEDDASDG